MVKLFSGVSEVGAVVVSGDGWCCCWRRLRRRPNVRLARSGRAGLRRRSLLRVICSWSSVRVGSMNLMLSMCGKRGPWSKNNGVGQLQIFWWIWKAALRRSFHAWSTNAVMMTPKFLRVLVSRAMACGERHGLILVFALAVSAKEAMRLVVQAPFQRSSRCGLLVRPVRRALQRSDSCGSRCS